MYCIFCFILFIIEAMAGNKNSGPYPRKTNEKQIARALKRIAKGESCREIADEIGITYQYLNRIYRKTLNKQ